MTSIYVDIENLPSGSVDDDGDGDVTIPLPAQGNPYPDPILKLPKAKLDALQIWLDGWLVDLQAAHDEKVNQWAKEELLYRAQSEGPKSVPFEGACGDVIPLIAMGVDPVYARIDTSIFKANPIFHIKPLTNAVRDIAPHLETFINHYARFTMDMRRVIAPRLLELVKHGTCVLKTVYEHTQYDINTYDKSAKPWKVVRKSVTRYRGPRVYGVSLDDFMFPAHYQDVQDCPIVVERQRVTLDELRIAEKSGLIANVKAIANAQNVQMTALEDQRAESVRHIDPQATNRYHEVYEIWCKYDINGDGIPESLVITYHKSLRVILQLRYNWYFHQKYPYTVIPYSITNDSLYGLGIAEMAGPFQDMATKLYRNSVDNGYLANCRMFIRKREGGLERGFKIAAGNTIWVDDPKDVIPFALGDIYPSTLQLQQNIFGFNEKRTGISDYLTGRESPIVGSRATATSTLALIQEGTRRVEEVLENVRVGLSEVMLNCLWIWMQYTTHRVEEEVFGGGSDVANAVLEFFENTSELDFAGKFNIELATADATTNRQAQQQMQLAIIQVMMNYFQKIVEVGQLGLSAEQTQPDLAALIAEVAGSSRKLFRDLLTKYDIPNPDDYLPDLQKFLVGGNNEESGASPAEAPAGLGIPADLGGMPDLANPGPNGPPGSPRPAGNLPPSGPGYGV